jgi:hypothetical protein
VTLDGDAVDRKMIRQVINSHVHKVSLQGNHGPRELVENFEGSSTSPTDSLANVARIGPATIDCEFTRRLG